MNMWKNRVRAAVVFTLTLVLILTSLLGCTPQTQRQLETALSSGASTASVDLQTQVSSSGQTAVAIGIQSAKTLAAGVQLTAEAAIKTEAVRIQTDVAKRISSVLPPIGSQPAVLDYFALGDSIASGHGLMDSGDCRRSNKSYPYLLYAELVKQYKQVNFTHLACSGATIGKPDLTFYEWWGDKRFKWLNFQVEDVLTHLSDRPTLITITIGANDLHWTDKYNFFWRMNQDSLSYFDWLKKVQTDMSADLKYQIGRLRDNHPNVSILLTQIYNPFNRVDSKILSLAKLCWDVLNVLTCYERTTYGVTTLNNTYGEIWGWFKYPTWLKLVPIEPLFAGHESPRPGCGNAAPSEQDTWVQYPGMAGSNADVPPEVEKVTGHKYGDCFHPNNEGARQIALRLYQWYLKLGK